MFKCYISNDANGSHRYCIFMKTDRQTGASARIASECTEHSRTFRIQLPQVGEWCKKKVAKTPHQCREPSIPYLKKICPKCFANSQKQPPFRTWCARARDLISLQSSVAQRAQRRRCDRYTRTPRRLRTRNRSSPLRCFPPWCPARALLHLQRAHTCGSRISLMTERCFRTRAPPTNLPPSRGHERLSVCDELRSHTRRTRVPSSLRHAVGCCMSAPRHFKHPSSLQPLVVAYLLAAECTQASLLLSCSQDDRDANQLCSGEEQRSQRQRHVGGVFPGRDQDRVRIGRWDDQSLEFWCAGALKSPLLGQS